MTTFDTSGSVVAFSTSGTTTGFTTGGSAVSFTSNGSAVDFEVVAAPVSFTLSAATTFALAATNSSFAVSPVVTPGAHASTHGAGGADPITTLGAVAHSGQQTFAAGSAAGPSIAFTGDTNTGIYSPGADQVGIATAGTAAVTVDASQRLIVGNPPSVSGGAAVQVIGGDNAPAATVRVRRMSESVNAATISLEKTRGSVAAGSAVASGDGIGAVNFLAFDGTTYITAAQIAAAVDGSPATNDMPGRLVFSTTADGGTTLTERLRISNNGQLTTGLGSAGTPVLSFSGDTNTGIYSPGADQVGIATAGTAAVIVDSSGRVGIGTTPLVALTIYRATDANILTNGDGNTAISAQRNSDDNLPSLLNLRKARGTTASNAIVAANDVVGRVTFQGYDGATNRVLAQIEGQVDGSPAAGDMPGALRFYTVADGGIVLSERMRIDNAGLITSGTGTVGSLAAWTAYTPTLGGFTAGSGTPTSGAWCRLGKIVHFRAIWTYGTGSAAASARPTLTLPSASQAVLAGNFQAHFFDTSAGAYYAAVPIQTSTTVVTIGVLGTSGVSDAASTTSPFTWATGDQIVLTGTYELA